MRRFPILVCGYLAVAALFLSASGLCTAAPATSGNTQQEESAPESLPPPPTDPNSVKIYKKDLPSIVYIDETNTEGEDWTGTGFLAIKDGVLVTAWHVVHDAKSATARFPDGKVYDITGVIDHDPRYDVVLLKVNETGRPLLTPRQDPPDIGSQTYVLGDPWGTRYAMTEGVFSQMRHVVQPTNPHDVYDCTCSIIHGDSGAPLLDENGHVIGVVSSSRTKPTALCVSVPIKYALSLNPDLPVTPWKDITANLPPSSATKPNAPANTGEQSR